MSSRLFIGADGHQPLAYLDPQKEIEDLYIEIATLKDNITALIANNNQLAALHRRAEQVAARAQQHARARDVELDRVKRANVTIREELAKLETAVHQNLNPNKTEIDDILRKIMSTVVNIRAVTPPPLL